MKGKFIVINDFTKNVERPNINNTTPVTRKGTKNLTNISRTKEAINIRAQINETEKLYKRPTKQRVVFWKY